MKNVVVTGLTFFFFSLFALQIHAETLKVALSSEGIPPVSFPKDSNRAGVYSTLFKEFSLITGDTYQFVHLPQRRLIKHFNDGLIDIEPGINPIWRENNKVPGLYSVPFMVATEVFVFAPGKSKKIRKVDDLFGERIGVISGYVYPKYAKSFNAGVILREDGENERNLLFRLAAGRFNQVIVQANSVEYWMAVEPEFQKLEVGPVNYTAEIMMRVHPSKAAAIPRLNNAIHLLKNNGKIREIYQQFLPATYY